MERIVNPQEYFKKKVIIKSLKDLGIELNSQLPSRLMGLKEMAGREVTISEVQLCPENNTIYGFRCEEFPYYVFSPSLIKEFKSGVDLHGEEIKEYNVDLADLLC